VIWNKLSSVLFQSTKSPNHQITLLVGLGNPGAKYSGHRHNIGFMTVDAIADHDPAFGPFKSKFQGEISEGRLGSQKIFLLKPQTYMNESGRCVGAAAKFYKIPPERIIVFHDELDLDLGQIRVKKGGGNAGHNGLKSIQAHLGTPDFWRVRLGIGHPGHRDKVTPHVLGDFSKADQDWLMPLLAALAKHYETLAEGDPNRYAEEVLNEMNR
jgi:PTH1 family peptidyl-tRNA hydrolase